MKLRISEPELVPNLESDQRHFQQEERARELLNPHLLVVKRKSNKAKRIADGLEKQSFHVQQRSREILGIVMIVVMYVDRYRGED